MRLTLSCRLDCAPERAWAEVQTSRLLFHVSAPLVTFRPVQGTRLPELWSDGRYRVWMWLFGVLPLGRQWVDISRPPVAGGETRLIRDNGSGDLVRVWDHVITIASDGRGRTLYTDRVDIAAGLLTPVIWLFACVFYAHRQSRWRALARRQFRY